MPPSASKKTISSDAWDAKLSLVKVSKEDMNKLVMNFLVTEVCASFTPTHARIQHHCSYIICSNISKGSSAMANQTAATFKHQQLEPGAHPTPMAALRRHPFPHMHIECESVQQKAAATCVLSSVALQFLHAITCSAQEQQCTNIGSKVFITPCCVPHLAAHCRFSDFMTPTHPLQCRRGAGHRMQRCSDLTLAGKGSL